MTSQYDRRNHTRAPCLKYYRNNELVCPSTAQEGLAASLSACGENAQVDVCVGGSLITGVPTFADNNTLRMMCGDYSYLIPLDKVVYIRGFAH